MPTQYIQDLSKAGYGSIAELESKWDDAKKAAEDAGMKENWGYITSIFKVMVGVWEKSSVFDLTLDSQRLPQISASAKLLSWNVYSLKEDFMGFKRLQKVLVRRDTETPPAKRGVVNYWVMSPKDKKVVCLSEDIFKESVYKASKDTIQDRKYDRLFWSLVDPVLKENEKQRRRFGYVFYRYQGAPVKISDNFNAIVLKPNTIFTIYKYGERWSLRAVNTRREMVDVDGLREPLVKKIVGLSEELPPVSQPTRLEQMKDPIQEVRQYN